MKKWGNIIENDAQVTIEYAVMFVVIVAAILASTKVLKPSFNKFFNSTAVIINAAANEMECKFG